MLFRGLRREKMALSGNSMRVFPVLRRRRILLGGLSWRLGEKSFFESVDDASDSAIVDEQPQTVVSQLQIGEKLLLMHRRDGVHAKGCIDLLLSHGTLAHSDPLQISRQAAKNAKKDRQEEYRSAHLFP
jgi:hypothetical protein